MQSQTRLLPRLDQLYLQKQSYEAHKKKLTTIKRSGSLSKRSLNHSQLHENQEDAKSLHSLSQSTFKLMQLTSVQKPQPTAPQNRMETIQQAKPGLSYWLKKMNPLQKRLKQQQIKENKRMRQKIKNTMSFVVQSNKLDSHAEHYKGMKNMLNKFQIDNNSKKTKLKCEIVLKKITQIEKQKLKLQQSRILQYQKNQKSSQSLLNMSKNTQIIAILQKKQNQSPSAKRNQMLSEKINLITRQSTSTLHKTAQVKNINTIKNNLIQHKDSILTRNRSQFTSKTNSLVRDKKDVKTFTPKLSNSSNFQRIKTQHIGRNQPKRLFNSSKLSNLSTETAPQTKLAKDYKILRVNFTQKGEIFKRVPNVNTQNRYKNDKGDNSNNGSQMKKDIASRIRTEVTEQSRVQKPNREGSIKRFDYQKKRIERFIKSKSSLSVKDVPEVKGKNAVEVNKRPQKLSQKRPSIVQEKIEESMQTIDVGRKQEYRLDKRDQSRSKEVETKEQSAYFATQII